MPPEPGSGHSPSLGTPFPYPRKAGSELPAPATSAPGYSPATVGLRGCSCLSSWFAAIFLVRSLLFRHLVEAAHLLGGGSCASHQLSASSGLCAACWDAHWPWAGWQPQALGKRSQGQWGHPFLLARTSGMSVNLFIAGVTVLSALPDNSERSDAF